jgi:hypothetical protein
LLQGAGLGELDFEGGDFGVHVGENGGEGGLFGFSRLAMLFQQRPIASYSIQMGENTTLSQYSIVPASP